MTGGDFRSPWCTIERRHQWAPFQAGDVSTPQNVAALFGFVDIFIRCERCGTRGMARAVQKTRTVEVLSEGGRSWFDDQWRQRSPFGW